MKANAPLWIVSLGQGGGDSAAVGGPGAPVITNPEGGLVIAFTAGEEGAAGPTLGYGASIEPEGPTLTVDVSDPAVGGEIVLSDSEPFTDYVVTVYGVNVAGRGKSAQTDPFQLNYNEATGGTETYEDDYNNTGQRWKIHTFTSGGSLDVTAAINPFHALLIGGGGAAASPSGNIAQGFTGGGGGSGGVLEFDDITLTIGSHAVSVGNGAPGTANDDGNGWRGGTGGASSFAGKSVKGGGGGGNGPTAGGGVTGNPGGGPGGSGGGGGWGNGASGGGAGTLGQGTSGTSGGSQSGSGGSGGGAGDGTSTSPSGAGRVSTITGSSVTYAQRYGAIGGGGPGPTRHGQTSQSGKKGRVIIAYQVGSSSSRQIAEAKMKRAAREAAHEAGYDLGFCEGRDAYEPDLQNPEPEPEPTPEPDAPAGALFSRTYLLNSDPSTEPGLVYPSTNYIKLNREDALVWQENVEEGVDILCELIPDGVPTDRRRYFNLYYYVPQTGSSKLKFYDGYDGSCPAYLDKAYKITAYPAGQIPDDETLDATSAQAAAVKAKPKRSRKKAD